MWYGYPVLNQYVPFGFFQVVGFSKLEFFLDFEKPSVLRKNLAMFPKIRIFRPISYVLIFQEINAIGEYIHLI